MPVPRDRRYTRTHEWHKLEGGVVTIGITRFAADQLTDITYVELPKPGTAVKAGQPIGEVESVKATSDLYSGVTGKVVEVNANLAGAPELVNTDSFGAGWMVRLSVENTAEYDALMSAEEYDRMIGQ